MARTGAWRGTRHRVLGASGTSQQPDWRLVEQEQAARMQEEAAALRRAGWRSP
jgi:hypothetical protein